MSRKEQTPAADARKTKAELLAVPAALRNRLTELEGAERGEKKVAPQDLIQETHRIYKDLPVGLCYLDTDLRYIQINDWLAESNGIPAEEHLGRTIGELIPDVAAGVEAQFRQVIDTGEPIVGGTVEAETPAQPGFRKHFQHSYYPVRSDDGEIIGISCLVEDVTARNEALVALRKAHDELEQRVQERTAELQKINESLNQEIAQRVRAEEALTESEERFTAFNYFTPTKIHIKDRQGRYILINRKSEELFGVTNGEAKGRTTDEVFPEHQAKLFCKHDEAVLALGEAIEEEEEFDLDDGVHTFLTVKFPIFDGDGNPVATGAIGTDITERKRAERALRDSESSLANAQRVANLGSWDWEIAGDRLHWSDEIFRIVGLEREAFDANNQSFLNCIHPDDKRRVQEAIDEAVAGNRTYSVDYRVRRPDGGERDVYEQGEVTFDDDGQPIRMSGTVQDITNRKQAEDALRESEERYALAMQAVNEGIYDWNVESDEIYYSPRLHVAVGIPPEEMKTCADWTDRIHPDDWPHYQEALVAHLKGQSERFECDFRYRRPDGTWRWARQHGLALRSEDGRVHRMAGSTGDITEQKELEEALRESEERFKAVVENAPVGIYLKDIEGRFLLINNHSEKQHGIGTDELLSKTVFDHFPEEVAAEMAAHDAEVIKHDSFVEAEVQLQHRDGSVRSIVVTKFPIHGADGRVVGIGGIDTDITERKRTEDQLRQAQKLEAVGQLTGGVAHDFNNLMAIMINNAELLEYGIGENEEMKECIKAIKTAVDRGSSLTGRLLAFSRQQVLSPVATDVSDLLGGLHDMLRRTLGETVDLRVESTPYLWPATIDPHQLENAVVNLAINARDAMPRGGTLVIETANVTLDDTYAEQHEEVTPGDYVMVAVSDTGTGMPPKVLEKVFEPFYTTKEVGKGSGLGLSMVYGFAKQSNGHIAICSEVEHGTTVKLYLPCSQVPAAKTDAEDNAEEFVQGSERILVVEDDPDVRNGPVTILRNHGYEVVEAGDGKESIDHLKTGRSFDLLFTDVVLPSGMNGVEIAEEAKRLQPNIKVLYTSGYAENAVVHSGTLDPGLTVVNKPYRRADLLEKVRALLDSEGG